jgi:thiamine biosynthesis lipoprotein
MTKRALLFLLFLSTDASAAEKFVRTQVLMGDVPVTLTIEASPSQKEKAFAAMEGAFAEAQRLERSVSEWREESQTTRLNRNAGKAFVPVDGEMTDLLLKAQRISERTDGAFDITFSSRKRDVSFRDVIVLPELGLAYLRPGVKIGVSGIAKGYVVDAMARVLRKAGFRKFLVDAGDLYAAGRWKIGIRNPNAPGSAESLCEIKAENRAVSTSGLYERGPHIVDPKTGRTPRTLKSVTVIAKDSTTADALATGLFVLGSEGSECFFGNRKDVKGLIVGADGRLDTFGSQAPICRGQRDPFLGPSSALTCSARSGKPALSKEPISDSCW